MHYDRMYGSKPQDYFQGARREVLDFLPANIRLALDVGCSAGAFGQLLKERGMTVWGVEPNAQAAEQAKEKLDVVINDVFSEHLLPDFDGTRFDCIFFVDVLEHFVEPEAALALCRRILKPGGYVVSAIPNILQYGTIFGVLLYQDWKYVDAGILDRTHLRFFTRKSIIRMFEECGYTIEKMKGIHQRTSAKFAIFNMLTLGKFADMRYTHFITVARANEAT